MICKRLKALRSQAAGAAMSLISAIGLTTVTANAQSYTVISNLGEVGASPYDGVTIAATGDLYGTTSGGGYYGANCGGYCGIAFEMTRAGSSWLLVPLYEFTGVGNGDGSQPRGKLVFGPDGSLYGTTVYGGAPCLGDYRGCGTVFKLGPPPTSCRRAFCPWTETVLYRFTGGTADGAYPQEQVTFDQAGNIYGITPQGGNYTGNCLYGSQVGCGTVFELTPSSGGWTESLIYAFNGATDGARPSGRLFIDPSGNVYGTTPENGPGNGGTVFELTPTASGWTESTLYSFSTTGSSGYAPSGGVTFAPPGSLYGTTAIGGTGQSGTVFELAPGAGGWTFNLIYSFTGGDDYTGPTTALLRDSAGNLYGTTFSLGEWGTVFELSPANGGWTYTLLHQFTDEDGAIPMGDVALDAAGNLYGTTFQGGQHYAGVVWEITP